LSLVEELIKRLQKDIPDANIEFDTKELRIIIPINSLIKDIKNKLRINPIVPVDIKIENNNIIICVKVMP